MLFNDSGPEDEPEAGFLKLCSPHRILRSFPGDWEKELVIRGLKTRATEVRSYSHGNCANSTQNKGNLERDSDFLGMLEFLCAV